MDEMVPQDEQALLAQLGAARERLDGLAGDLRSVDTELEGLSKERQQYRLLGEACTALEALSVAGAGGLFWGEADAADGEAHLRQVQHRVEIFDARVGEIEGRRQQISQQIRREQENTEFIEDDLYELRLEEEKRKLEWVIERDGDLPARASVMAWTRGGEEDERFRRSLGATLLAALLIGVLLPLIDLPLPEPGEPIDVPERLARLIEQQRPLPPAPPPAVQEPTQPKPEEPEPVEHTVAESEPTASKPHESPKPSTQSKGILAFREKFSGLAATQAATRLGSNARIRSSGEAASGRPQRSMVATQAPGSSGGINLASLSRDVGGGGGDSIEGVQVTRATSSIGSGNGTADRPRSGGPGLGRTDEEIQIVFDRHKAALYRLYNRELRRDPTLKGQMVLRVRIEPDGSVSLSELHSTDMDAPQLAARVVDRVRTFDFGAKEGISTVTILYPIDFLPAT